MRVVFLGSADISAIMLGRLFKTDGVDVAGVVTPPDKPAGRQKHLTPCPCKAILADIRPGIHCFTPAKINSPESLAQIRAWKPDVLVVVAYGQFLGKELLSIPKYGCINIHLSLLPRYRGASPIHAAILNGDKETGVTAMLMDEGMDSGDILMVERTPIHANETTESLHFRLALMGGDLLAKVLPLWVTDDPKRKIVPVPQDESLVTFAYKIKKTDGLLDWNEPSEIILRKIRAFTPWPGCYTHMPLTGKGAGKVLKIHSAEPCLIFPDEADAAPGTVLRHEPHGMIVRTPDGGICVATLQIEGGRPLSADAFICGHPLCPGDRLGLPVEQKENASAVC